MSWFLKLLGNSSGNVAEVDTNGQLKTVTSADDGAGVRMFSENDAGTITGTPYVKSPETSPDYRLRAGTDVILFNDTFNATTQNTNIWAYTFATMTAAQAGDGLLRFSAVQGTTSAHGAFVRTFQYFPLINTAPLAVEFVGAIFTAALVAGEVWLSGLGLPTAAVTRPTDGVWFKLTSAGLVGVIAFNGTEAESGVLISPDDMPLGVMSKYTILVGEREIEYWVDDVLIYEQEIPTANGIPWMGATAPVFMMKYNTGAVSNTNTIRVARVGVSLLDVPVGKDHGTIQSGMGMSAYAGLNGHTQGLTAGNFGGAAAFPGAQTGSNASPNAGMAGLGGVFQMTAQASAAGANGDMVASYYLNPASTINITGRNLIVKGVKVYCMNYGAIAATTGTSLVWGVAYGHLSSSLAVLETGTFVTATTHSPRKIPIGMCYIPKDAAVGVMYSNPVEMRFDGAPLVVRPGEYLETTVRFLVGTATASLTVAYTVTFDAYFE